MRRRYQDGSSRATTATATTLVALVAMAAGASALPLVPAGRVAHAEAVASLGDAHAVRAMAAVMVAAARDLLAGHRSAATLDVPAVAIPVTAEHVAHRASAPVPVPPGPALPLNLIDLPPPVAS
jgi:uncharacterized membrane protein